MRTCDNRVRGATHRARQRGNLPDIDATEP
jgi:hypothetical protein